MDACRDFFTWEIEIRRVVPPDNLRSLTKVFDGIAASVLENIKPLPDELPRMIDGARSGKITQHTIELDFAVPPQIARFNVEMEWVNHHFNG